MAWISLSKGNFRDSHLFETPSHLWVPKTSHIMGKMTQNLSHNRFLRIILLKHEDCLKTVVMVLWHSMHFILKSQKSNIHLSGVSYARLILKAFIFSSFEWPLFKSILPNLPLSVEPPN